MGRTIHMLFKKSKSGPRGRDVGATDKWVVMGQSPCETLKLAVFSSFSLGIMPPFFDFMQRLKFHF
jgi:hypothetical protein